MKNLKTLGQFIIEKQADFPYAKGELSRLLRDIGIAAKIVNSSVNQAGLLDILAETENINVHGERQKDLDVYANEQFIAALRSGGECCLIISEENENVVPIRSDISKDAKYIVAIDPLDGSSNIDVNISVGTIFSIYRIDQLATQHEVDIRQLKGTQQVAAGYVIYGSSTMLVYTTGKGVNGFTLDPAIGEFCLSHPDIKMPADGSIYSVNEGNNQLFAPGILAYINYCQQQDKDTMRPYSARYTGSLVADIHRNLLKGGIFLYPASTHHTQGKLRLLYECNPLAFIIEQAGGLATDGDLRILDKEITTLHERSPLIIGSQNMVKQVMSFLA